jgi:hypothetical protein
MKRLLVICIACSGVFAAVVADDSEYFTNVYVVPPTFLNGESGGWSLTRPTPAERYAPRKPHTAKTILEEAGITFGKGTSAIYNAATSQLIVRNTEEQMESVEAYLEKIIQKVELQVFISVREVRFQGEWEEVLKRSEATAKLQSFDDPSDPDGAFSRFFQFPESADSKTKRSWSGSFGDYESFREELARPLHKPDEGQEIRRIRLCATLTDPQFQVMIRSLGQNDSFQLRSFPSLMLRSGHPGLTRVEQTRIGFVPVLGADEKSIVFDLFIPADGEVLFAPGEALKATLATTLRDNEHVVLAEKNPDGNRRLIFIQAQLQDPAGMPIQKVSPEPPKEEAAEHPAKFEPGLGDEARESAKEADKLAE